MNYEELLGPEVRAEGAGAWAKGPRGAGSRSGGGLGCAGRCVLAGRLALTLV